MTLRTAASVPTTSTRNDPITASGMLSGVSINNIIGELPANPNTAFPSRSLEQIKRIIVHHSAVSDTIGPRRLAKMAVSGGKPGLPYHFFIARNGKTYQTNQLTVTTAHTPGHDQDSVAVCFAGNFVKDSPNDAEIRAGRRLIQVLGEALGVTANNVNGASELSPTQSPGQQWLQGRRWKNQLLNGLLPQSVQPQPSTPVPVTEPNDQKLTALNTHIAQLTAQLAQAKAANQATQDRINTLNRQISELQTELRQAQSGGPQSRIRQLEGELAQAQQAAQTRAAEAAALRARVTQLEAALAQAQQARPATQPPASMSQPRIQDISGQLPRHQTARYATRNPADITTLIIHHTAVAASVSAARLAGMQVSQGKPGIVYHYIIDGHGSIQQTNPDTTVAQHTPGQDQHSLAIAFAGNFSDEVPSPAQLEAGANLLAFLQQKYKIAGQNIKGASEVANIQSPGNQWLAGQRWKTLLLNKLPAAPQPAAPPSNGNAQVAVLQARITELETLLTIAQEATLSISGSPNITPSVGSGNVVSQPAIEDVVDDLPRHPSKRYQNRPVSAIKQVIVHHSAVPASVSTAQIANFNVNTSDWPGIGFHYFVGIDGTIQQTNDLTTVSYHAGSENSNSIGVAFAGDFDEAVPTQAQITAGAHLIAWFVDHLDLPLTSVHGHKEFANTTCPGEQWDHGPMWRNTLFGAIRDNLAGAGVKGVNQDGKTLYHYLLFWQTEQDWAKKDLENAANYIARFRPTLGFSIEDATDAEYVTIIGGPLGVSAEDEARLRASGCKVERLAGNSEAATKALLDNLARQGKRFLRLT